MPRVAAPRLLAAALVLALAGCAALPMPVERPESHALGDVAGTTLGRVAAASTPDDARGLSGFRLLPEGDEALEARIALIRDAEKSVDVQYYLIANDRTGRQVLAELAAAAARGVRVRVLVDDLYAVREDALFAALAGQPGFEVRLFNPLPVRGGGFASRVVLSAHQFARINHRMHNKLLIADNSFAITGGRNIADEYFDRSGAAHFIDMDLLSSGSVVAALSALFDEFWNSPYAYPAESLLRARQRDDAARGASPAPTPALPEPEVAGVGDIADGAPAAAPGRRSLADELAAGHVAQRFAAARVVADQPAQIADNDHARPDGPVMRAHLELIGAARSSVLVATPYFVPGAGGLAALREARAHDVRFSVLTNSLATTDEPLVHFGYARYRLGMLRLGVALHELMPTPEAPAGEDASGERHGQSLGRLHAKLVVVDDRWVSIGSMNMDRRSARSNTESAIVIDDPVLAAEVAGFLERGRASGSYALRLGDDGKRVEWVGREHDAILRVEPRRAGGPGLKPRLASFFVSEEML
ncbi:MAG TPA: phospholipase D family protein [Caldimonas sp.]|jgi:putative cardiolipin synthase|nr:phospholipase D family protein [Caldimonas sp.]